MIIVAAIGPLTRFRELVLSRKLWIVNPSGIVSVNVHHNLIETVVLDVPEQCLRSIETVSFKVQGEQPIRFKS